VKDPCISLLYVAASLPKAERPRSIDEALLQRPRYSASSSLLLENKSRCNSHPRAVARISQGPHKPLSWTGTITLVTGGTMQGEHPNNGPGRPGETLDSGIDGGKEIVLHAGDIVHIPAGIPHWIKLTPRHHHHLSRLQRKVAPLFDQPLNHRKQTCNKSRYT
jgi:hypothetical protein